MGRKVPKNPVRLRTSISVLVFAVGALALAYVVTLMCGCAVGQTIDGQDPMFGFRLGDAGDAAKTMFGMIGGALFGPPGAAIGTAIGGLIIGHHRGTRKGWDEKEEDMKKETA